MKIIFFGSSDFAVPVLEALKGEDKPLLVVTQPDRKKGRSLKLTSTSVKIFADKLGIDTFQPDDINSQTSIEHLKKLNADLFVVVSFGHILQKELLEMPKLYSLNVHASLLPKYRGAAPINWAIANGDKVTGITIIKMDEKMDEGEILLKEEVSIGTNEDAVELSERLSKKGSELLLASIDLIKKNIVKFTKQDSFNATYAPKLKKQDGLIDWSWPARKIYNRVRAFVPWPGCFTYWNGSMLKIWKVTLGSELGSSDIASGTILEIGKKDILVSTGEGAIRIEQLQLEGKRRMKAEEFIAGHRYMRAGEKFTK